MVLAVSYALNTHAAAHTAAINSSTGSTCAEPLECGSQGTLRSSGACGSGYGRDVRASSEKSCSSTAATSTSTSTSSTGVMYATPQQKRLAEITEMIHTASLFHDDVIDKVIIYYKHCFTAIVTDILYMTTDRRLLDVTWRA